MTQNQLFTQKELVLLTKTRAEIKVCAHEIIEKKDRGWELRIQYKDRTHKRAHYMKLATARGNVRLFKSLETVIDYIKQHCPHVDEFIVYFGGDKERKAR